MKRLILVRHAKTEQSSSSGSDFDRKLTSRGHSDSKLVADVLLKKGFKPSLMISSPAVRAIETAQIMASAFSIHTNEIVIAPFIYDGNTTAGFLDGLATLCGNVESVMVVGHNPDMAMLSMKLTSENFYSFPTTSITVIDFEIDHWTEMQVGHGKLEYHISPKMIKG
jgi:phosphohistidine phosphatase